MRYPLFLLLLIDLTTVKAQLVNGSFEMGGSPSLMGWFSDCPCAGPVSSMDVPGGTGSWSVRLNAQYSGCICGGTGTFPLAQPLPWITSGAWVLSGWIKGVAPDTWDGTQAIVFSGTPPGGDYLGSIGQLDSVWSYESVVIIIPPGYPADSLRLVLAPAGLTDFGPYYAYYDDLSLDQTTGFQGDASDIPAFRFDASTSQLYVDLHEMPDQVWLIDGLGRYLPTSNVRFRGHTLEVDTRSVACGPAMLVMFTASGLRTVRFVKV